MTTTSSTKSDVKKTLADTYSYDSLLEETVTKSAMIRRLDSEGFKRMEIAKFMDIRYQHVRNVLVQAAEKKELEALRKAKK